MPSARTNWALIAAVLALLASAPASAQTARKTAAPAEDTVEKARTLDKWGDRTGALRLLAARAAREPFDPAGTTLYGTMLLEDGRYDEARPELERVLHADPKHTEARRALIRLELRSDHAERARELATQGLESEPDRADLLLDRARTYLILGKLEEARADLDHLLAKTPHHPGARELRQRIQAAIATREIITGAKDLAREGSLEGLIPALAVAIPAGVVLASLQSAAPSPGANATAKSDLVVNARALSQRGDRAGALELLKWHLEATPTDSDAMTLYGTILSWEGRLDESREQLARVLKAHPGHYDAIRAAIHVELLSDHPERAEELATQALQRDPDSIELLLDRARARLARGEATLARADIDRVLVLEPNNEDARKLRARFVTEGRVWAIGGSYSIDAFSDGRTPWHEATLQAKRSTSLGSVIVRGYEAWRFDTHDNQFELEAFPKIREGTYLDVAAAFSPNADLYPQYRVQADIYQTFPLSLEASLGYRHLQFGSGVDMAVVTLGKYLSDWYFTLRAFITPGVAGTSVSASGSARRYLLDGLAYVGLRYGYGISKEELRSLNDIALLASNTLAPEAAIVLYDRLELGLRGSISEEARVNRSDLFQYDITTSVGFRF